MTSPDPNTIHATFTKQRAEDRRLTEQLIAAEQHDAYETVEDLASQRDIVRVDIAELAGELDDLARAGRLPAAWRSPAVNATPPRPTQAAQAGMTATPITYGDIRPDDIIDALTVTKVQHRRTTGNSRIKFNDGPWSPWTVSSREVTVYR